MSPSVADELEEPSVIVSLHAGPAGTVRLSYDIPQQEAVDEWLRGLQRSSDATVVYPTSITEVDGAKLRDLSFTQQELAEIGFALVAKLSAVMRRLPGTGDA